MKIASILVGIVGISIWLPVSQVSGQYKDMLERVPETANSLVLVNAKAIFNSPIAKQNKWGDKREARFSSGLTSIPPNAGRLVIAANLDVETMRPSWEVAVVQQDVPVPLSTLAARYGSTMDTVGSLPAVRFRDNCYVLQFADGLVGAMAPGNRQQVAQWISRSNSNLTNYLQQGVKFAETGAEVIMALDTNDAFTNEGVTAALAKYESIKQSKVDQKALANLLASLRGVMLGITFRDKVHGSLKIDFGQNAEVLAPIAKPLIIEILGDYGVMITEVESWEAQVKGQQVFLSGPLAEEGLTRLASLIQLPTTVFEDSAKSGEGAPNANANNKAPEQSQSVAATSQEYFNSVIKLLQNLETQKKERKTWGQLAQWFENYARKIDRLPTLHVDKEMLQYGNYVSTQLHLASQGLKGVNIQKRVAEVGASYSAATDRYRDQVASAWTDSGYPPFGLAGYYGAHVSPGNVLNAELARQQQARTQVQVAANAQQASTVQQIIANIVNASSQIRQSMTDKFQVQF